MTGNAHEEKPVAKEKPVAVFEDRVRQLQEANAAVLKALAPIFAELTMYEIQERFVSNKFLTSELADGLGAWRLLHGRCGWETLVARANVHVEKQDVLTFSSLLRETHKEVTGWWPIYVPRISRLGTLGSKDDVYKAVRRLYARNEKNGGNSPASALQLFAFAARNLLSKKDMEDMTVVTLDPCLWDLGRIIPVLTIRSRGPLQGRRMHLYANSDVPKDAPIWVASHHALFDTDLTPDFHKFV